MLGVFGVGEAAISISSTTDNHDFHGCTIRRAGAITDALADTPVGGLSPYAARSATRGRSMTSTPATCSSQPAGSASCRCGCSSRIVSRPIEFDHVAMVYGVKTPADFIFERDITQWEAAGVHTALTVDVGDADWRGAVGVAPSLLDVERGVRLDRADTTALVCGPDVMMHFTAEALVELGVRPDRIWLTLERNMQCGNALCGHCQLGPFIVCRDGPVANYAQIGAVPPSSRTVR